jgi:signal transduction histidine kinase
VPEAAGQAVTNTMFRALAVLRFVVLVNAIALYVYRHSAYNHPVAGAWVMVGLALWTAAAVWAYESPHRRVPILLLADLAVAVGAILITPYIKGSSFNATLPGFWVAGVVLAWAICWRMVGGVAVAAVVSIADVSIRRGDLTQTNYANIFLLIVGGAIVGFLSDLLQRTAVERDQAEREAAAAAERQRLARVVHDGVLQVLALVQRRGAEIGGEAAELGRLAGDQEVALRALVQQNSAPDAVSGARDLGATLAALATSWVSVAVPASPVMLPATAVDEITAVVTECLTNVRQHLGHDAPAWVLVEDVGSACVISVRDDGPGIPAGRLEQAAAEGRLGVASSIRGRVADQGGTATLASSSEGTEWEFRFPR